MPADDPISSDNDLFQVAFQHAAIGMTLVGLNGEFLKVNQSLCKLIGYPEEELIKLSFQDITFPEDLESDLVQTARLRAGEISRHEMEKRYITKFGAIVWVLLTASVVRDASGKPLFFISQIMDITTRKEAEAGLRRTLLEKESLLAELQRSNSEITDLRSKLLTICAWTKRVRCHDQWVSVDEFLVKELGLTLTHGMSAEAEDEFMNGEINLTDQVHNHTAKSTPAP